MVVVVSTKWQNISLVCKEEISKLLAKDIARTVRIQLDGRHLPFGEYLQN